MSETAQDVLMLMTTGCAHRPGVLEELADSDVLREDLDALTALAASPQANTRADAAHYLGLTYLADAAPPLQRLLDDPHPDVREIAAESLQTLVDWQEKR